MRSTICNTQPSSATRDALLNLIIREIYGEDAAARADTTINIGAI